jgi:glycosyltransferase involved in cell wall biosynthesis
MVKKKILILMGRYLPGFKDGGPVRTIVNLVDGLHEEFDFYIVANDRDHNDITPYSNIQVGNWNKLRNAMVYYVPPQGFTFSLLRRLSKDIDVIYCCGPYNDYSYKTMILKKMNLIKQPVVIASMGSFSLGAYNIKKTKKKIFTNIFKLLGLFTKIAWSVTSTIEEKELKEIITKSAKCYIAEDLPRKINNHLTMRNKKSGELNIVFISRISRKKNLKYAIEIISKLKGNIRFSIYGNKEDMDYWHICEGVLKSLPKNISWKYEGIAESENVLNILQKYDLFLFPTLGENYGHVIYEALAAGCIPVISDTTPWLDLTEKKCGNVIPLNNFDSFINILQNYVKMNTLEYNKISSNSVKYAIQKNIEVYESNGYREIFNNITK